MLRLLVEGTFEELHWTLELACELPDADGDIWLEEFPLEFKIEALENCVVVADCGDMFPIS